MVAGRLVRNGGNTGIVVIPTGEEIEVPVGSIKTRDAMQEH